MKCAALARFTFHPNRAAHHGHKFGGDGQAQTGTAIFSSGGTVGLREGFKNLALMFGRNADAGIFHRKMQAGCAGFVGFFLDIDEHFAMLGKFDRVPYQIDQDLANSARVTEECFRNIRMDFVDQFQILLRGAKAQQRMRSKGKLLPRERYESYDITPT